MENKQTPSPIERLWLIVAKPTDMGGVEDHESERIFSRIVQFEAYS